MQSRVKEEIKARLEKEKNYLRHIKSLHVEEQGFFDNPKYFLGFGNKPQNTHLNGISQDGCKQRYLERISQDDCKKIDKLLVVLDRLDDMLNNPEIEDGTLLKLLKYFYEKGHTKSPGLPAWMYAN